MHVSSLASCPSVAETPPAGHAGAAPHLLGQILSRDAGREHEDYAGERHPARDAEATARGLGACRGKHWFDERLHVVGKAWRAHDQRLPQNHPVLKGALTQRAPSADNPVDSEAPH